MVEPQPADSEANAASVPAQPETQIYGSLLGPGFIPITGVSSASVSLVDASGVQRNANVSPDGAYTLHALSFGSHWVTVSADGFLAWSGTLELLPAAPTLHQDFTLQPAQQLRVRVITPDGMPLHEALQQSSAPRGAGVLLPVATREQPGSPTGALSDPVRELAGVGRFVSRGLCAEALTADHLGILALDCELPVWVSLMHHQTALQSLRVDPGQDEITFILAPGDLLTNLATIRVQAVDAATEQPIPAAHVRLRGGAYSDAGVATDLQGVALITDREPGRFDLEVRADGYASHRQSIAVRPGETCDLGTVALGPEVSVMGTVMDLDGLPVAARFDVGVMDRASGSIRWFPHDKLVSGGDGSFHLEGLSRAEYFIRTDNHDAVNDDAWQGVRWVSGNLLLDTRGGSLNEVEIRLRPATALVLRAAAGDGQPLRFSVLDELGLELLAGTLPVSKPRSLGLPAGKYQVLLLDAQGKIISERRTTLGLTVSRLDFTR